MNDIVLFTLVKCPLNLCSSAQKSRSDGGRGGKIKMTIENMKEEAVLHGRVKWFDPAKGFGFVVADVGGPDILLHANVLRNFGQSSIADGSEIELLVQKTERGMQAIEVRNISPPEIGLGNATMTDLVDLDPEVVAQMPLEPARVKWFDKNSHSLSPQNYMLGLLMFFCITV